METQEQIDKLKDFAIEYYEKKVHDLSTKGLTTLLIDFSDLLKHDPEIADILIEDPEEVIKATEIAVEEAFSLGEFKVRFFNLPKSQFIMVKDIRSAHLGKFMYIEGIVRQSSDVRPQVTSARFECPSCGNTISILQLDTKFKEPSRCTCGKRGNFRLLSKDLVDAQRLVIEESPELLEGGEQPKRLSIFLKEDLVEPKMEKKTTPGSQVRITGVIKEVPVLLKTGAQSIRYDLMVESNFIEPIEETFEDISLDDKDIKEIKKLGANPEVYNILRDSIAPPIFGHERIKEALLLQLMGGVKKERPDGTKTRGDMHMLLVGDPGTAKSSLIVSVSKVAPKARLTSGKSASGAGLCLAPDSLIQTNPGGIHEIKDLVNNQLEYNHEEFKKGIWKSKNNKNKKKIFTLNENLKITTKKISDFWKIDPPEYMVEIILRSGKKIKVTPNTKLYTINKGTVTWKESSKFTCGEYLGTGRELNFKNSSKLLCIDLIKSNPVLYGIKSEIKNIVKKVSKKESLRSFAKRTGLNENNLYYNWINEDARGNIHLDDLRVLIKESRWDEEKIFQEIKQFSLYKGHKIKIPLHVNNDLMYFAGLIAGDGDLCKNRGSVTIRFSNNSKNLMKIFKDLSKKLFNATLNLSSKKTDKRSESWRFGSNLVSEILNSFGIPISPKSEKLDMSNTLLRLPNNLLKFYIKGCFDSDGSVVRRRTKGSNHISYATSSKKFAMKLQLSLLRFGIHTKIRSRKIEISIKKDGSKIVPNYEKYLVDISGREDMVKFRNEINFSSEEKSSKLNNVISQISKSNTNIDVIPGADILLKKTNIDKRNFRYNYKKGISRIKLKRILENIKEKNKNSSYLKKLSESDIFWDEIIEIKKDFNHGYEYVYDITVNNSHNFIANGVIVHNTAVVVRDEFLRGWALEAGAMVLANGGYLFIDELDKMTKEDRDALHEGLEQQRISIAKANIQAVLKCETTVLAAANPKLGRFDPYTPLASQIDLPSTLINRFDLIFPVRDLPSKETDAKIATHVLNLHKEPEKLKQEIPAAFFKKYLSYIKQKVHPKLTDEAIGEIRDFYVSLRNTTQAGDEKVKPIPISARQLEALVRLSEGSARVRLSKEVKKEDAKRAIELLRYCLMQVGFDHETGQIDMDMMSGIPSSERSKLINVREIINSLNETVGKQIPLDNILEKALEKGIEKPQVLDSIEKLKREGEIFEPKIGIISKL
ncbi:hypothetical protein CL617_04120 [archaeon]|nr:hypothetical protein [archaeon]|tara:strand:- start:14394 stop:18041 length:3648 start_codon:yes stop_codon:yes gene_type:complete